MIIAMTGKKEIVSKAKGQAFVIVSGINKRGEAVKAILASENAVKIANVASPSPAVLDKALGSLPFVNIEFGERGRAESAYPADE